MKHLGYTITQGKKFKVFTPADHLLAIVNSLDEAYSIIETHIELLRKK